MTRGRITKTFTVWCGGCQRFEYAEPAIRLAHAERIVREYGWSKTKAYGWLCRHCKKAKK